MNRTSGSALNLNVHFHMLLLDGVYVTRCADSYGSSRQVFRRVNAPAKTDLEAVLHQISTRLAGFLVKEGVLTQDLENSYLSVANSQLSSSRQLIEIAAVTAPSIVTQSRDRRSRVP